MLSNFLFYFWRSFNLFSCLLDLDSFIFRPNLCVEGHKSYYYLKEGSMASVCNCWKYWRNSLICNKSAPCLSRNQRVYNDQGRKFILKCAGYYDQLSIKVHRYLKKSIWECGSNISPWLQNEPYYIWLEYS